MKTTAQSRNAVILKLSLSPAETSHTCHERDITPSMTTGVTTDALSTCAAGICCETVADSVVICRQTRREDPVTHAHDAVPYICVPRATTDSNPLQSRASPRRDFKVQTRPPPTTPRVLRRRAFHVRCLLLLHLEFLLAPPP